MNNSDSQSRLKIWLLAIRPKTLWAAAAPVIIGTAMAHESGSAHWLAAAAALVSALFIQIGTNLANDYFDFKKGADNSNRLGPMRVTQSGLIAPEKVKSAAHIAFKIAFIIGIYLVVRGGWPIVIIGLLSILFGILYTGGPYPLGYNGLGDIFVLIFFGPIAVGGTYYVQALDINSNVLMAGFAPGLLSVAILTVNNLRDIESDRIAGKKTLAVRFGAGYSKFQYLASVTIAALIPPALWLKSGEHLYALISSAIILLALPVIKKVYTFQNGAELNKVLERTGQILLIYAILFSIGWLL